MPCSLHPLDSRSSSFSALLNDYILSISTQFENNKQFINVKARLVLLMADFVYTIDQIVQVQGSEPFKQQHLFVIQRLNNIVVHWTKHICYSSSRFYYCHPAFTAVKSFLDCSELSHQSEDCVGLLTKLRFKYCNLLDDKIFCAVAKVLAREQFEIVSGLNGDMSRNSKQDEGSVVAGQLHGVV